MRKNWHERDNLQIICQRANLIQDDRMELPILTVESLKKGHQTNLKKVWINVVDLKNWTVLQAIDIDLLGIELN